MGEQEKETTSQAGRDRALTRLDEREIRARLLDAFDEFLSLGFAVHLIGVRVREGLVEYRLALYPDGTDAVPSSDLQRIADEFRLDYSIERGLSVDGFAILLYPRW